MDFSTVENLGTGNRKTGLPKVSVIIPTLNSASVLGGCLESIRAQDYPPEKLEIVIADASSTDETLAVAERYSVDRVVENSRVSGEAGKSAGFAASTGEVAALIDSDNLLPGTDWLRMMTRPFAEDPEIVGTEPLWYSWRRGDPMITRYCALTGVNDPLVTFLGNYDRLNYLTGRWTGLDVKTQDKGGYLLVELDEKMIPTMGANGFLVRSEALRQTKWQPYLADIDTVYDLACAGLNRFAKVKVGIVHLYCPNVATFVRKQRRRIRDYTFYNTEGLRRYPWKRSSSLGLARFILYCLTGLPLLWQALRGYSRKPDRAWFFHPLACWLTLWVYATGTVRARFSRKAMDRKGWKQ
ncbi:MAG: glycosyltransferase family 2 protein [Gemmatimonadota bacterium]|nr:glycosyltransferase family 2 protein [Gemmatimonadota bacterium]